METNSGKRSDTRVQRQGFQKIIVLFWIKNMKNYWNGNKAIP